MCLCLVYVKVGSSTGRKKSNTCLKGVDQSGCRRRQDACLTGSEKATAEKAGGEQVSYIIPLFLNHFHIL